MAGAPFVARSKFALVIVKPVPLMVAHSSADEFHSFVWKLYTPLSSGVTSDREHVDWATAIRELPMHIAIAANPIAAHFNFFIGSISIGSPASNAAHADSGFGSAPLRMDVRRCLAAWGPKGSHRKACERKGCFKRA